MNIILRDKDGETMAKIKNVILPEYEEKEVKNEANKPVNNVSKVVRHLIDKETNQIKNKMEESINATATVDGKDYYYQGTIEMVSSVDNFIYGTVTDESGAKVESISDDLESELRRQFGKTCGFDVNFESAIFN